MLLAQMALGSISKVSGLLAGGLLHSFPSPLPIRNFFLWWLQHMYGVLSGADSMFCTVWTMRLWSTC